MQRPNHSMIALMAVTCVLLLLATLVFSLAAPHSRAAAFLQASTNTPYFTPALEATLIPFDHPQSNAGFGYDVSVGWGTVVVGAPYSYSNQGAAYIFEHENVTDWVQKAELIAPDGDPGDLFGTSVHAAGGLVIVGAPGDDSSGVDAGAVYVYWRDQGIWKYAGRINAPDAEAGDQFGFSVSYSFGSLIVGAPGRDEDDDTDVGAAYIFDVFVSAVGNHELIQILEQKLTFALMYPPNHTYRNSGYRFGYAVDMYVQEAIVAAFPTSDVGNNVHYFRLLNNQWRFQLPLLPQPTMNGIGYGQSVAIYQDIIVVGAPYYDGFGTNTGRIYVYRRDNGSSFAQLPDGEYIYFGVGHQGGYAVDAYREVPAAGAPYATVAPVSPPKGSAKVYYPDAFLLREPNISDGAGFGWSVAIHGVNVVVGVPYDDYGSLTDVGSVYVYRVVGHPWATPTPTPTNYGSTATLFVSTLTPSATPTDGQTPTSTPSRTPTSTPATSTAPPNANIAPHFFAVSRPTLTWDNITWALGYQIQIDDDPAFASPITAELSANTLSYTLVYPLANDTYYWQVRAKKNETEWSNWSATETIIVSAP